MTLAIFLVSCMQAQTDARAPEDFPIVEELPDPFLFQDGRRVRTPEDWRERREEIRELILRYEYGHMPPAPGNVRVDEELASAVRFGGSTLYKELRLSMSPGNKLTTMVRLYIPKDGTGPYPAVLRLGLDDRYAKMLNRRGYAYACFEHTDLDPDTEGHDVRGPAQMAYPEYDWGSLAVWAWGASRVLDYLETRPDIDTDQVVITGHSRTGKVALLAGALDERFALVVPNGSGCGGAGCYRDAKKGVETLELITLPSRWKSWLQEGFGRFSGKESRLPFDQHFLRALVAPRPVLSTDGLSDGWANPPGTQAVWMGAQPVFDFLGVGANNLCHFRPGGHDQAPVDYEVLLDVADHYFKGTAMSSDFSALPDPAFAPTWPWQAPPPAMSIVPAPVKAEMAEGTFVLDEGTKILHDEGSRETAMYCASALRTATGYPLPLAPEDGGEDGKAIVLTILDAGEDLGEEGYRLVADAQRIAISARRPAGLFYGVQTLRQLLPPDIFSPTLVEGTTWEVACVEIEDYPRFAWRGMLLDVARHFMPKESVKKFIDAIALHKMNSLQLHLTDDQGWRVEIKQYPELTRVGAWRSETLVGHGGETPRTFDGKRHGGFYTQDDVREIVAYAAERHVTIVPEIEMPGHAQAAIAAYPELGNRNTRLQVWTRWGVNENIFNADEDTIVFLQNVLDEVAGLFPSQYIHIGGDEAVKKQWERSEAVQARIKELGLKDEHEMQSYFIGRMDDHLAAKGRRLLGWDEIIDGGLAKGATVMAWRSKDKAITAAKAGHDVVMAQTTHTYFDYYQGDKESEPLAIGGFLPLKTVYGYDPLPETLTEEEAAHILGAQGQLWTEYIATPEHAEYMAFPRTCALAEAVWTPQQTRSYEGFLARLKTHLERLKRLGVNYRPNR